MNYIKTNFLNVIVLVLVSVLFIERCNEKPAPEQKPIIIKDTFYMHVDSIIYSKPQIIKTIEIHKDSVKTYLPDSNYKQFAQDVLNQLLAKNIQQDSIKIDSIGYVKVTDTVQRNMIIGRSSEVSVKYPIIRETVTLPYVPKNQLYVGGSLQSNQISGGLLFKNKKDQIFGGSVGLNNQGQLVYGVQSYWKIKLK
jgi:hypothetical protein